MTRSLALRLRASPRVSALALHTLAVTGRRGWQNQARLWYAHDLLRNAIRLLLVLVAWPVDRYLGLNCRARQRKSAEHCLVANCTVQCGEGMRGGGMSDTNPTARS